MAKIHATKLLIRQKGAEQDTSILVAENASVLDRNCAFA